MTVIDGAEAIHLDAGPETPASIVVCHGFSGTPASVRPWAEHMHERGYTVTAPRLPGHGTRWQDLATTRWPDWYGELERAFDAALDRGKPVFVLGHSMGGTLALRLAQQRGDEMAGLVVCNPSLFDKRLIVRFGVPWLKYVMRSARGIGSDIAKPNTFETSYPRIPLMAVHSLSRLWQLVSSELSRITVPIRVFHSAVDHVVDTRCTQLLLSGIRSRDVRDHVLPRSYHVVPLDFDAPQLCEGTAEFVADRLKSPQEAS